MKDKKEKIIIKAQKRAHKLAMKEIYKRAFKDKFEAGGMGFNDWLLENDKY